MNRKQKIIVSITGIFIVLLALVGLTYAFFLTRITGNTKDKSISIETANLELVYGDGNNAIEVTNIEPGWTTDGKDGRPASKTFTVTNNGNSTVEGFNIYLENVINQLSRKSDLVYTISCKDITTGAEDNICDEFQVVTNEVTTNEAGETEYVFPSVMSVIATDTLEPADEENEKPAEVHEYTISLTYKEMNVDQSEDMDKLVQAKVNIYDSKTEFLSTEILKNAMQKTRTTSDNAAVYTLPSDLTNKPGSELASALDESVLSYDYDNYGTSYYFRGNVFNNFVEFADMCWRIVRIEGDGSIKLILEHKNVCGDDSTYTEDLKKDVDNGRASEGSLNHPGNRYFDWTILGTGNYGFNLFKFSDYENVVRTHVISNYMTPTLSADNTQIEFKDANTKEDIKTAPTVSETMATVFYDFQEKLRKELSSEDFNKLKVGEWCIADDAYLDSKKTIDEQKTLTQTEIEDKYGMKPEKITLPDGDTKYTNEFYFESYLRLYSNDVKTLTFKCKEHNIETKFSEIKRYNNKNDVPAGADMYVGALTADETMFAGAVINSKPESPFKNSPYSYLINKSYREDKLSVNGSTVKAFYTLSPRKYDNTASRIYTLQDTGQLNNAYAHGTAAYRPVIILKNTVQITDGNGTLVSPYKIG